MDKQRCTLTMPTSTDSSLPRISEAQIIKVFREFDIDNSGDICIDEFEKGINRLQLPLSQTDIINVLNIADTDKDGKISLNEFREFVISQDDKIRQTFSKLDINSDHALSPNEIRSALRSTLNLEISNQEIINFIEQFSNKDSDHQSKEILFNEFRNKVLLLPAINTKYIYELYKPSSLALDIGEDYTVPSEQDPICKPEYSKLNIFISGGICGAISRTATAPADRLKVFLYVFFMLNTNHCLRFDENIGHVSIWGIGLRSDYN